MATKTKSNKNVAIEANTVEISTKQTTVNNGHLTPPPPKQRLGLVDINEIRKGKADSKENVDKELGFLSQTIESQAKYRKTYCIFNTVLSNTDQFVEKIAEGGYDVIVLDNQNILVRW